MFRLLVSAGGTAGGVYPALAVVEALSGQAEVLWIGGKGGIEEQLVPRAGIGFEAIPAAGIHGVGLRRLPGNLRRLIGGYRAARAIMRTQRPAVMLLTGGYVGVPVALAGLGIPKVSYVPDLQPGLALRLITRLSDTVTVTSETARLDYGSRRVVVTGYPTRRDLKPVEKATARAALKLDAERMVVLAFGGSQGARSINEALWRILPALLDRAQVVHLTGERDRSQVNGVKSELPERLARSYHVYSYLHEEMGTALAAADLAITRAGAATLGELPLYGLPAVLVPYPHAWRYQRSNAQYLVDQGAAIALNDESLAQDLLPKVRGLLQDPVRLGRMAQAMSELARPGAAKAIADEVVRAAGSQQSGEAPSAPRRLGRARRGPSSPRSGSEDAPSSGSGEAD